MALIAKCSNNQCGATLRIPDSASEAHIRCPQCGAVFPVSEAPAFVIFDLETGLLGGYQGSLSLEVNDIENGSRGRARTYNITVNSRALYH